MPKRRFNRYSYFPEQAVPRALTLSRVSRREQQPKTGGFEWGVVSRQLVVSIVAGKTTVLEAYPTIRKHTGPLKFKAK